MARCPECEYRDTSWFGYTLTCKVTGEEVGDEHHREKTDYLCTPEYGYAYENCPIYKAKHR